MSDRLTLQPCIVVTNAHASPIIATLWRHNCSLRFYGVHYFITMSCKDRFSALQNSDGPAYATLIYPEDSKESDRFGARLRACYTRNAALRRLHSVTVKRYYKMVACRSYPALAQTVSCAESSI